MRQIVVITVMAGLLLSALPAQAGPLREAATLRAATAAGELQAGSSPQRRRSVGRTVGGIFLMAVGTPILLYSLGRDESLGGPVALGGALVVSGALLASVWADVPVANSLDFRVAPHRVQVSKAFGF